MNVLVEELKNLKVVSMDAGLVFSGMASGVNVDAFNQPISCTPKIDHST